jgi:hypothetical protein
MKPLLIFFFSIFFLTQMLAQEKSPYKFTGQFFVDYFYNIEKDSSFQPNSVLTGSKDFQAFQFRRINFTFDYDVSSVLTSRFRIEADQSALTSNGKIGFFVKDAFIKWKNIFKGSDLTVGIQPPPSYEIAENFWGFRSVEKTIMDLRGIAASRDFGISLRGKIDSDAKFNYWALFANNSGTSPESDKYKRYYLNLHFKPVNNFQVTIYGDFLSKSQINDPNSNTIPKATLSNSILTTALFFGYSYQEIFRIGVEGFMSSLQNGIKKGSAVPYEMKNKTTLGITFFSAYVINPTWEAFGRFDYYNPNIDADYKGDLRNLFIGGISYKLDKNVSIIPNVFIETYEKLTNGPEIKSSITGRITLAYSLN